MTDILLVEDNLELAELIRAFLKKEGFFLFHVTSAEEAEKYLKENEVNLILLDIMLPDIDGFAFCKRVRRVNNTAIFIISARVGKEDKLLGFELGADDYIEKPIDSDLLVAKIRALFYRMRQKENFTTIFNSGAIQIDSGARKVYFHGQILDLTVKEYELLFLFVQNAGKTLQKEYLFNQIWGMDSDSEYQTLTVHIQMLRSKIEENPRNAKRIQTVWGVGYRYEEV